MLPMITIFHELNRAKNHFGVVYERFISFISFMPLDFELFYEARFENFTKTHHTHQRIDIPYSARTAILPCFSSLDSRRYVKGSLVAFRENCRLN